ncbi:murein biosynthesis integral membrane protein MurJ [Corynebacterium diphtheriae]|nr:murein biosynthesis integral membrane protein MurJ [Corynebacterium diphtheriae]CAB0874935.1 murein biosynthesis integral membrane protein MurJ [Corynebacterium diphtheriae]
MNPTNPTPHPNSGPAEPQRGTRHRIVTPAAPAPVPAARPQVAKETSNDRSKLDRVPVRHKQPEVAVAAVDTSVAVAVAEEAAKEPAEAATAAAPVASESDAQETSDNDVVRSTGSMAIATLVSRITGFLRTVLITTTLGGAVASAFNTGNTLPNLITEIVLGAVLTSLVVPVLVRAEKEDPDRGEAFIRRLFTLASTLLIAVTIIAVVSAPWLSRLMLRSDGKVNLFQTTSFAYLLLPQIYFYGIFALLMAVLNTKQIFKPGAWAPVANNVITIVVLVAYMLLPGEIDPDAPSKVTDPHVLLLGLGTTLGVVVQLLIMIPPIRRAGVSLKPLWGIDARLKQFGGMALAIIVYVAISQWGYIITTRIASHADAGAPNIYQQHWLLLQVPYGIIGVTLLTAIMPRLSRNAADGDDKAVVRDLVVGSKLTFIALIPIVVFFSAYGERIGVGLFAYRRFDVESASILGLTLAYSAFTLLPYALVLLHLRVFYAREEAWTPTFIIAGITGTKVVLSMLAPLVASDPSRVVILLGAANGFGFVSGALIGAMLLRRKLGNLGSREVTKTSVWALGSSLVGIVVALGLSMGMDRVAGGFFEFFGSVGMLIHLAIVGVVFLVVTALVLSRSGLEEVVSLGYALQRIPGMRRVIKMKAQQPADTIPTNEALAAQALTFDDTFNATPIPAPMSAGIVRGPRLVPGAQVSDGRFRLLADHGSVSTARFWHAREKATGRDVALVFVDTSGSAPQAPASPAAAAGKAAEIARRTRALAGLHHPAIAPNIEVLSYRNGCLVVADWVRGSNLSAVADSTVNPYAAVYAFEPLAQASVAAEQAHTPLGIDNHARIRINTDGMAVLAFPAVLSDSSYERDLRSLRTALGTLIDVDTAPKAITALLQKDAADLPQAIADLPDPDDAHEEHLNVTAEETPKPTNTPGFGSRGFSRSSRVFIAATAVLLVVVLAIITAYVTSVLGGDKQEAPITKDSIAGGQSQSANSTMPGIVVPIISAETSHAAGNADPDVPDTAPLAIDTALESAWQPSKGDTLVLNFAQPYVISRVIVDSPTKDMTLEVRAGDTVVGTGTVTKSRTKITVTPAPAVTSLSIRVVGVPDGVSPEINDVKLVAKI